MFTRPRTLHTGRLLAAATLLAAVSSSTTAAVYQWSTHTPGITDWNLPGNWGQAAAYPGSSPAFLEDIATIAPASLGGGTLTIQYSGIAAASLGSLTLARGTLNASDTLSLAVHAPLAVTGALLIDAGTSSSTATHLSLDLHSPSTFNSITLVSTTTSDAVASSPGFHLHAGATTVGNFRISTASAKFANLQVISAASAVVSGGTLTVTGPDFILGQQNGTSSVPGLFVNGGVLVGTHSAGLVVAQALNPDLGAASGQFTISAGTVTLERLTLAGTQLSSHGAYASSNTGKLTLSGGLLFLGSGGLEATSAGNVLGKNLGSTYTINLGGGTLGATANWSSAARMTLTGTPTIKTANATDTPFNIALSGTLTGTGTLRKTGLGTLTLSQSGSSYSGGTLIEQGTLLVAAPNGVATGTGPITVHDQATYAGAGNNITVGPVTVRAGGHIAPGHPAGGTATLNFKNLILEAGAFIELDVAPDGLTQDTLRVFPGGTLTMASPIYLSLRHLGQTYATPGTYTLCTGLQNLVGSPASLQVINPAGGRSYAFAHSGSSLLLTITSAGGGPVAGQWTGASGGDWNATGNWSGGQVPGGQAGDSAMFGPSAATFAVSLNAPQRLAAWSMDSATGYTFSGGVAGARVLLDNGTAYAFVTVTSGIHAAAHDVILASPTQVTLGTATQLTLSGTMSHGPAQSATGLLVMGGGTLVLSGSTSQAGPTTVAAGTLRIAGSGPHAFGHVSGGGTLEVAAGSGVISDGVTASAWVVDGTHVIRSNGSAQGVSRVDALAIGGTTGLWTGSVDLVDNALIVESESPAAQALVIVRLADQVASGRAGGTWVGKGVTSSTLAGPLGSSYGLAVTDAGDINLTEFRGTTVNADSTLVVAARHGDATLDGQVDAFDLNILAAHWQGEAIWSGGDFTGEGKVDAFDLNLLAANWQFGGGNLSAAIRNITHFNSLSTPEPTSLAILAFGLAALLTRPGNRKKSIKLICTSGDSGVFTSKPLLGVQVMRRIVPLALAAAVGIGMASQANAAITTSVVPVQVNATLEAAGWSGYYIVLTADAASQNKITTLDFKNDPLTLGGTIGISGPLHQRWGIGFDNGALKPTPSSASASLDASSTTLRRDSVFLNSTYYNVAVTDAFTETNNLQNGSAPTGSPLADVAPNPDTETDGANHGVGSLMTFSGAANVATALGTLNVAFVIVPSGGTWVPGYNASALATVQGAALDPSSTDKTKAFPVQLSYVTAPIPEPASLGVLALGGLSLLARRRKA